MLLIKAEVKPSAIHGIGLFAAQHIPEGAKIWKFSPGLDLEISPSDFEKLDQIEKEVILFYGFHSKKSGNYHLSFDSIRFMNHSEIGNVSMDTSMNDVEYPLVANREIRTGEELTQNYYEFDEDHQF